MEKKHSGLLVTFGVTAAALLFCNFRNAEAQAFEQLQDAAGGQGGSIPSVSAPSKVGCANGVPCGGRYQTTYNGVEYDCICNCSSVNDDCTPRSQPGKSGTNRRGGVQRGAEEDNSAAEAEAQRLKQEQQRQEQERADRENKEAFTKGQNKLMGGLKGGASTGLSLHTSGTTSLPLKDGRAGSPVLGLKTSNPPALKTGSANDEAQAEQDEFEKMNAAWMKKQKQLFEQRLQEENRTAHAIYRSFKTNAPPPLFERKYDEMQPGDVLLITPEEWTGTLVMAGDNVASYKFRDLVDIAHDNLPRLLQNKVKDELKTGAPFSHTVIYLKTVNGKKLFLDNQRAEGPRILSEEQFLGTYASRGMMVAALAQPLNKAEGDSLMKAARHLALKQKIDSIHKANSLNPIYLIDKTNYGSGWSDMVCSEASRWALMKAGRQIPPTDDRIKRKLGIEFSPADFLKSEYFIVTEMKGMPKAPAGDSR